MKTVIRKIYMYLFLGFCFILPLDKYAIVLPNIVLIGLIILYPFVLNKKDIKHVNFVEITALLILVFSIGVITLMYHEIEDEMNVLKKVLSIPLLIILSLPLSKTKHLSKAIIFSALVCIIVSIFNIILYYISEVNFDFASGSHIDQILIIDRLYLGLVCVLNIICTIHLLEKTYKPVNKWYFTNLVITILFVLLIASRVAIGIIIVLFFLKVIYSSKKSHYLVFTMGILATIVLAFMLSPSLQERFLYTQSTQEQKSYLDLVKQWEPRVVIMQCNYRIAQKEDVLFKGIGFENTREELVNCYEEIVQPNDRKEYFIRRRFNAHNTFVDLYLSKGLVPTGIFLLLLGFTMYKNRNNYFKTALLISSIVFLNIESIFHRQLGVYYFAIILILLWGPDEKKKLVQRKKLYIIE